MKIINRFDVDYTPEQVDVVFEELVTNSALFTEKLKTVTVPVLTEDAPDVVKAIHDVFGPDFVTETGGDITYEMYKTCIRTLRQMGRQTVEQEIV